MRLYSKEELWNIYKTLPEDLKDAMGSLGTADRIASVCERHQISAEQKGTVTELVGYVLMGLLHPSEFEKELRDTAGLDETIAQNVAKEISRLVFYPVRPSLEQLFDVSFEKTLSVKPREQASLPEMRSAEQTQEQQAQTASERKKDTYREPVE